MKKTMTSEKMQAIIERLKILQDYVKSRPTGFSELIAIEDMMSLARDGDEHARGMIIMACLALDAGRKLEKESPKLKLHQL